MIVHLIRSFIAPLALMAGLAGLLTACNETSGGVQPGVVQTSSAYGGYRGESGRVTNIREVNLRERKEGISDGTLIGGGVGMAGGALAGGLISGTAGGAVVGGVLGAVAGGIAGTAVDRNQTVRGIEVTVHKDDGQVVTIAQRDDGDVQMGDRVAIVYNDRGVARAVRDSGYRRD